jgi:hypothetical protein
MMVLHARMGGLFPVFAVVWLVVVGTLLVTLWRGMRAQEKIAGHLEGIERTLSQRPLS